VAYAEFFLRETASYCADLNGGEVSWSYLSDEYGYMDGSTKDYFVSDSTIDSAILAAQERYLFLIGKYENLAVDSFMTDSDGIHLSSYKVALNENQISKNSQIIFLITFLVAGLFGFILLSKKYVKKINH